MRSLQKFAILLFLLLNACMPGGSLTAPSSAFSDWKPANVHLIQEIRDDAQPQIIAVYSRQNGFDLEIRCDFLALSQPAGFDLYVALDTRPGGTDRLPLTDARLAISWDAAILVPALGSPKAFDTQLRPIPSLVPRVVDDPRLAARVIQINRSSLPGNINQLAFQVFLTQPGQKTVFHQTPPVSSTRVASQAPLLLVFWDALPAATPAQTLRRWDGAHTGPIGGRHGLSILLKSASEVHVPVVLADLNQPASLSGLSALGQAGKMGILTSSGEVLVPEMVDNSVQRETESTWRVFHSSYSFGPLPESALPATPSAFAVLSDSQHLQTWQGRRLVPLPSAPYSLQLDKISPQVSTGGFSREVLQALLRTALSADPSDLVVLGGSLPTSAWGDFSVAPLIFETISRCPWIRPLDGSDLEKFPAKPAETWPFAEGCHDFLCNSPLPEVVPYSSQGQPIPSRMTNLEIIQSLKQQMLSASSNGFWQQAKAMLQQLTAPSTAPNLPALQANYLGQVGYLLEAGRWANHPGSMADCSADLDFDGTPECRLSSETWLAILKTDGARLVFAASRTATGASQWVGPTSQFAVGLSDPSTWNIQAGPSADPNEIPGGFAMKDHPYQIYQTQIQSQKITFSLPDRGSITYQVDGSKLQVSLKSSQPIQTSLPVTLAPQNWLKALPVEGWLPAPKLEGSRWTWAPNQGNGLSINVQGASQISAISFLDSLSLLSTSEDPNRVYPPGHFLPFPMALIELQGNSVQIELAPIGK